MDAIILQEIKCLHEKVELQMKLLHHLIKGHKHGEMVESILNAVCMMDVETVQSTVIKECERYYYNHSGLAGRGHGMQVDQELLHCICADNRFIKIDPQTKEWVKENHSKWGHHPSHCSHLLS
jgi:hypothetical protein